MWRGWASAAVADRSSMAVARVQADPSTAQHVRAARDFWPIRADDGVSGLPADQPLPVPARHQQAIGDVGCIVR